MKDLKETKIQRRWRIWFWGVLKREVTIVVWVPSPSASQQSRLTKLKEFPHLQEGAEAWASAEPAEEEDVEVGKPTVDFNRKSTQ